MHVRVHRNAVATVIRNASDDGFARRGCDYRGGILVADDLVGLEDRFENIARAESSGEAGEIGANRAAIAGEVMAGVAVGGGEHCLAVLEVAVFQFRGDERSYSSIFHSLTNGRSWLATLFASVGNLALMMSFSASRSAVDVLARQSFCSSWMNVGKLLPPR